MKPTTISPYGATRDKSADYLCDGIRDEIEIYAASEAAGENGIYCASIQEHTTYKVRFGLHVHNFG